ncbi:MAG TPA: hypothetical protein QGH56_02710 [Candidatus Marinimicrobia bacterium]|jgi:hypothetical protein|nr:hypothetical protein [Candidatus Neomarinimicrobiota bacterium]
MNPKFPIVRMYTDESGHTRFAKMYLPLVEKSGLGSVGLFSSLFVNPNVLDNSGDLRLQFAITPLPNETTKDAPKLAHTAPRKQLVITLGGCLEFKSCDVGVYRSQHIAIIKSGDVLLAEDLDGAGHVWRFLPDDSGSLSPWMRCYLHLGEEYDHLVSQLVEVA